MRPIANATPVWFPGTSVTARASRSGRLSSCFEKKVLKKPLPAVLRRSVKLLVTPGDVSRTVVHTNVRGWEVALESILGLKVFYQPQPVSTSPHIIVLTLHPETARVVMNKNLPCDTQQYTLTLQRMKRD